jgi:hypothetical protein
MRVSRKESVSLWTPTRSEDSEGYLEALDYCDGQLEDWRVHQDAVSACRKTRLQ